MMFCRKARQEDGGISLWDLLIFTLAILLAALLYQRGYADPYLPAHWSSTATLGEQEEAPPAPATERDHIEQALAAAKPAPGEQEPLAITAVPTENGATPDSAPASTPAADPAPGQTTQAMPPAATPLPPLTLATLERQLWPPEVKLLKSTEFPIVIDGKTVGKAAFPSGTLVTLTAVEGETLLVKNGEAAQRIPAADTDLLLRAEAIRAAKAPTGAR